LTPAPAREHHFWRASSFPTEDEFACITLFLVVA